MGKFDFDVAVGFAEQTDGEGTFSAVLDAIDAQGTWSGQGGAAGDDEGLLLGDADAGINGSGLDIQMGRRSSDNPKITASQTTPLSNFEAAEVRTLTFAFPFCGNRFPAPGAPVAADTVPLVGMDALLKGVGVSPTAVAATTRYRYATPAPNPFSTLIYYFGNRLEFLDCLTSSMVITYPPGSVPIAVATIAVGSVRFPTTVDITVSTLPTLNYGNQNTVAAPIVENAAYTWSNVLGNSTMAMTLAPSVVQVPDSNAGDGFVSDIDGRETSMTFTNYADDTGDDETYELGQIFAAEIADLDAMSWRTGLVATTGNPVSGHTVLIPQPEVDADAAAIIGTKAANTLTAIARNNVANLEWDLVFD